jgi:hypothetical protein
MQKMTSGEAASGPSFVDKEVTTSKGVPLIPNEFIIFQHFDAVISAMEARLSGIEGIEGSRVKPTGLQMAQETIADQEKDPKATLADGIPSETTAYDPKYIRLSEPVPVNPRLFPGLHLGYGKAVSSHTKREVLKMRLVSIILNKLVSNYYKHIRKEDTMVFSVRMPEDSPSITTPSEFIECLIEKVHEVDVVPTSRLTTFGVGLCVKEEDDSWTNVPLCVFLESGYEDKHGNMALAMMPHSGINMSIRGTLAGSRRDGTPSELAVQHFIGIEGFCGWKSDANPVVPINDLVPGGEVLTGKDAVRATRLAGLYVTVLIGLPTELELSFGGYGATALCNDSAAIIQKCLFGGDPAIYPMTKIGRFAQRTIRYAQ